jgi:hypothetical protein
LLIGQVAEVILAVEEKVLEQQEVEGVSLGLSRVAVGYILTQWIAISIASSGIGPRI